MGEILTTIFHISNDNVDIVEFNLSWFAYCLTGITKEQKMLFIIGHTAGNGKSTLTTMFESAFNIYSKKIGNNKFDVNNNKKHKTFAGINKIIRYVYMEEMNKKKIDIDILKDFVDGNKIGSNEVMYGTTSDIIINCKLTVFSNHNPNFDSDYGMRRRGILNMSQNDLSKKKNTIS